MTLLNEPPHGNPTVSPEFLPLQTIEIWGNSWWGKDSYEQHHATDSGVLQVNGPPGAPFLH